MKKGIESWRCCKLTQTLLSSLKSHLLRMLMVATLHSSTCDICSCVSQIRYFLLYIVEGEKNYYTRNLIQIQFISHKSKHAASGGGMES